MLTWLPVVPILAYVVAGVASTWLGFWYFQAFAYGSVAFATIAAVRMRERWPVVHPALSLFYEFPAFLIAFSLVFEPLAYLTAEPLVDWLPWLAVSIIVAVGMTAVFVFAWQRHIECKSAAWATFLVVLAFAGWTLETLNVALPQPAPRSEQVRVLYTSPGGYKQGGARVTIAPSAPYRRNSTRSVTWSTFISAEHAEPICLNVYRGALTWRWTSLRRCER